MKLKSGDMVLVLPIAEIKDYFGGPILTPLTVNKLSYCGSIIINFNETVFGCCVENVVLLDSTLLKELT